MTLFPNYQITIAILRATRNWLDIDKVIDPLLKTDALNSVTADRLNAFGKQKEQLQYLYPLISFHGTEKHYQLRKTCHPILTPRTTSLLYVVFLKFNSKYRQNFWSRRGEEHYHPKGSIGLAWSNSAHSDFNKNVFCTHTGGTTM